MSNKEQKLPSIGVAFIPLVVLTMLLYVAILGFGSDAIGGASQIVLLVATAVCVCLSMIIYKTPWKQIEDAMVENIRASATAIIILLLIGATSGSWMVSGVVPTMIYYGLQILNPTFFLVASCVICSIVSLMTGSSWTTVATIGIALMGIGSAMGIPEGWIAGTIMSGAYFGDKLSLLSDTTILASSSVEVPIFTHIRNMMRTTLPSILVALTVFAVVGFGYSSDAPTESTLYSDVLSRSFNISPWLLIVPVVTAVLIARRLPAVITLFISIVLASITMLIAQPDIVVAIAGGESMDLISGFRGVLLSCYGSTAIETGHEGINALVATRGMGGMMSTIWLIICAMCFGGAMTGSGMLQSITMLFVRFVRNRVSAVTATVGFGIFFNICTADQYISIILSSRLFKNIYEDCGLEMKLLSRSTEDSATVTSPLVPWSTCGMAQSTVLGISTFAYFPYCIFNLVSPLMSIIVAVIDTKIEQKKSKKND